MIKQMTRHWLKDDSLINSKLKDLVNEACGKEKNTMRIRSQVHIFEVLRKLGEVYSLRYFLWPS